MKLTILFGIVLGVVSFGHTAPPDNPQVHQFAEGMRNFGFKWSEIITKHSDGKNVVTSPTSAGLSLAMLYLGAGGNTKVEIKKALNLPESDDVTKNVLKRINDGLDKPRKIDIKIANKIFTNNGFEIKKEFKDLTKDIYRSEAESLDFNNNPNEASKIINDWVELKTNNNIKNLVSSDDVKDNTMVLVNAVYFKGKWKKPFTGKSMSSFHLNDKDNKNVTTMHGHGKFMYGDLIGVDAKYVILPYESDEETFNMFIIIPNEINGLKNIENNIDNIKWQEALAGGKIQNLHIDMPKFKLESTINVEPVFKEMGMNDMFSDKADFTDISNGQALKVSKVVQKAFIEVDEKGTEAAAATGIQMVPMSASIPHEPEIHVTIDRPFLFSIMMFKDHVENLVFYGRCVDPTQE